MKLLILGGILLVVICVVALHWMAKNAPEIDPYDADDDWGL